MASVTLEGLQKVFGDVVAVQHLDLQIKEGEFFTLLGPSGCGKTTTLRMIAGFYYPTRGVVRFGDRDMTYVPPEQRNTGMVFQNYALFPHMTVFENVSFGLKVRKISSQETKKRVMEALKRVRLDPFADRQVSQLSGGQQQRVALARSLVIEPEILLLDEPLSNLDARLRDEMRTEILHLQRDYSITTIYVTHDQIEALSMSDRIAVFRLGVCQQIGTPMEIYNEPVNDFVASFVGETNLFSVKVEHQTDETITLGLEVGQYKLTVKNSAPNMAKGFDRGDAMVSIQPEAVELHTQPPGAEENVVEGRIVFMQFTGSALHLQVDTDVGIIKTLVLNGRNWGLFQNGKPVWLRFPENRLRIMPSVREVAAG